jgi:squalene-hopene/tetraprenyl-beta-curcumene cyclase
MKLATFAAALGLACTCAIAAASAAHNDDPVSAPAFDAKAAARYLDGRMDWWLHWPNAARDHETTCVSCHTALPYALARPALHSMIGDHGPSAPEQAMLAHVVKRVRMWREVEPFYPDQTRGLPKSSESRGTEAVLNAVVLSARDAAAGSMSDDTRQAFANMWPLQFTAGELKGAWAWLNFHNAPWESNESGYFGAALAALAVGTAPGYVQAPEIKDRLGLLRDYLQKTVATEPLFNRLMVLWASSRIPGLLTSDQQRAIVEAAASAQRDDGGWSTASLGSWKRNDGTALDTASDGHATGLAALALAQTGTPRSDPHLSKAIGWLARHQDPVSGRWVASSVNKQRDPESDVGKFMSDAATAYAVLAFSATR